MVGARPVSSRPGSHVGTALVAAVAALLVCVPAARAGVPGLVVEPLSPQAGALVGADDAGRALLVSDTAEPRGTRRIVRREPDGRRTLLREIAQPPAATPPAGPWDAPGFGGFTPPPALASGPVAATTDRSGRILAAWAEGPGHDAACDPGCATGVRVAVADPGGPLRDLGTVPADDAQTLTVDVRLPVVGPPVVDLKRFRTPVGQIAVVGDRLVPEPASQLGNGGSTVEHADGTRYVVEAPIFPPGRATLFRRGPGADGWRSIDLGMGSYPLRSQVFPLRDGRAVVLGDGGGRSIAKVVGADGTVSPSQDLGAPLAAAETDQPGAARLPDGTTLAALVTYDRAQPRAASLLVVGPDGATTVRPWPGGDGPTWGRVAVDRAGSVLLAESRRAADGVPTVRLRRLSAFGGEDAVQEFAADRVDALRAPGDGGLLMVVSDGDPSKPTRRSLIVRRPDAEAPLVRASRVRATGRVASVDVPVRCDEGCRVAGARLVRAVKRSDTVATARAARRAKGALLSAGRRTRVRVRLSSRERATVRRAHRRGRAARLRLRLRVADPLGNVRRARVAVVVRPARPR